MTHVILQFIVEVISGLLEPIIGRRLQHSRLQQALQRRILEESLWERTGCLLTLIFGSAAIAFTLMTGLLTLFVAR